MEHPVFIAALVLGAVALLFQVIGLSTPNWFVAGDKQFGLWKYCHSSNCVSYPSVPGRLGAARAFCMIGFLVGIAGMVLNVFYFVKYLKNSQHNLLYLLLSGIFFLVSGISTDLSVGIMSSGSGDVGDNVDIGYSIILAVLGGVSAIVTGALILYFRKKSSSAAVSG